jgi:hypothetical protein
MMNDSVRERSGVGRSLQARRMVFLLCDPSKSQSFLSHRRACSQSFSRVAAHQSPRISSRFDGSFPLPREPSKLARSLREVE